MPKSSTALLVAFAFTVSSAFAPAIHAWDHGGHMTVGAIAFAEIENAHPELIDKIGRVLLAHPDPAPFSVAAGEAKGAERTQKMFIECSRWPDDARSTVFDRSNWHTARWPIVTDDATPEAKAAAAARGDGPSGQAIVASEMNFAMLSDPGTKPQDRAVALCWLLHLVGDMHEPMHTADLFSKEFPEGNYSGTLNYVADPLGKGPTMPLHMLWDTNSLRTTEADEVIEYAHEYMERYPRSALPELTAHDNRVAFEQWARESYEIAAEFAYGYGIETAVDPNDDMDPDRLLKNMIKWVVEGVSPVAEAPEVPAEYWEELQRVAARRVTLAGYRVADIIVSAVATIDAQLEPTRVP